MIQRPLKFVILGALIILFGYFADPIAKYALFFHGVCTGANLFFYSNRRKIEEELQRITRIAMQISLASFGFSLILNQIFETMPEVIAIFLLAHTFNSVSFFLYIRNFKKVILYYRKIIAIEDLIPKLFEGRELLRIGNKLLSEKELLETLSTPSEYSDYVLNEVACFIKELKIT
jgi:hypothetical protein